MESIIGFVQLSPRIFNYGFMPIPIEKGVDKEKSTLSFFSSGLPYPFLILTFGKSPFLQLSFVSIKFEFLFIY